MKRWLPLILVLIALSVRAESPSSQSVADDANQGWIVSEPEEIVGYLLFDPATVADRLPEFLRFITVEELAGMGVEWAVDYLDEEPTHGEWGISFFEIVRMGTFAINGRSPEWPDKGAAALWLARVAPLASSVDLGPGIPLLMLEFWMPDDSYAEYMRKMGYYATYGDVRLERDPDGTWSGSVSVDGLEARAECTPCDSVVGGAYSHIQQVLVPPSSFTSATVIQLNLTGHRIQDCQESSSWEITGRHPLAEGIMLGSSTFQFGYDLIGSVIDPGENDATDQVKPK